MAEVAVIGAGPMGLACAYDLLKKNYSVHIYEADDRLGGMSAHFNFGGLSIERYYHFICKSDQYLFNLLEELDLSDKLNWRNTKMGYFYQGRLFAWGNPIALLLFPGLDIISKLRYGLHMYFSAKQKRWNHIDSMDAVKWLKRWEGDKAYDILWKRLFNLKFHQYTHNLSAAWIWARIRRVGQSRKNMFQEQLGYLQGGSETLLNRLSDVITELDGEIYLLSRVERVLVEDGIISGIRINGEVREYNKVFCTIPLPFVSRLVKDLPQNYRDKYHNIQNIGVVCVIFKLAQKLTDNFWLNISDPEIEIPGIIEFSNLRPLRDNIVYAPYYLPRDHPKYQWPDDMFIKEVKTYLARINPKINDAAILDVHISRYGFAQPICPPNFLDSLPPIATPIDGLYIADTSYYYPEDRSISESINLGQMMAAMV